MWLSFATFLGGLGLFMLAVAMITDGLKLAAGSALRTIIARSTGTRIRGVASGALLTGIVQSSSAVTIATIGFVNAGLLDMVQALGIVYGANVGTTMTGWLVAAVGYQVNVEVLALPMLGIGMFARLMGPSTRMGAIGEAVAGFGLFFLAIDMLRSAFGGAAELIDLGALSPSGMSGTLAFVGVGIVMTVLTQSSSAAIALTLTAAGGGLIGIGGAAAMVIGANIGTTSTAAFAAIGATPNARRVAAAHVAFNGVTGAVALGLLPLLLWIVQATEQALNLSESPAMTLALFHTTFNVLGVALMWPLTGRLSRFLGDRFSTPEEALGRPQYLDPTVAVSPDLALDALRLELSRMAGLVRALVHDAMASAEFDGRAPSHARNAIAQLVESVERFLGRLDAGRIPANVAEALPLVLRISNHVDEIALLAMDYAARRDEFDTVRDPGIRAEMNRFRDDIDEFVASCDPGREDFTVDGMASARVKLREQWGSLKALVLRGAVTGTVDPSGLNETIDVLRRIMHMAERVERLAVRLAELGVVERPEPSSRDAAETSA